MADLSNKNQLASQEFRTITGRNQREENETKKKAAPKKSAETKSEKDNS